MANSQGRPGSATFGESTKMRKLKHGDTENTDRRGKGLELALLARVRFVTECYVSAKYFLQNTASFLTRLAGTSSYVRYKGVKERFECYVSCNNWGFAFSRLRLCVRCVVCG